MKPLQWHVGDVVKKLREQRRWNQLRLATVANVSKATVVRVEENEAGIKRETYEKIASALGVDMGQLFSLIPGEPKGAQSTTTGATFPEWDGKTERRDGSDRRVARHPLAANAE